ncbi:MAG: NADP-dependent phosphogluconate dehydrogenase [Ferruginibacter sp.]
MQKAQFGMIGLGTMGRNLLLNIADHGIAACGYDKNPDQQKRLLEEGAGKPVQAATSLQAFVDSLESPRRIMMLVPAGKIVDAVINEVAPLLQPGDILIDGGNSHFTDTDARIERLKPTGIHFTGMGVSGGEDGARFGPSMMPGGNAGGYHELKNILEKIAAQSDEGPCVTFIGNGSAGHYTKMVHNGIEYAIMQLISEVYALLKNVAGLSNDELHEVFAGWDKGKLQSFLVEITSKVFLQKDEADPSKRLVDAILDRAGQKGTGMWTSNSSLELHVPTPTINDAVTARDISVYKTERMQVDAYHSANNTPVVKDKKLLVQQLHDALYFGMMISYVQGLHQLHKASAAYNYDIDLAEVVRIWKGGCIIRSAMLNDIRKVYLQEPTLNNLLLDKHFYQAIAANRSALVEVIKAAMDNGIGVPCLSSSLHYFDMFSTGRLPSNLIQAQRDLFGAHTYERLDKEGSFHTNWD